MRVNEALAGQRAPSQSRRPCRQTPLGSPLLPVTHRAQSGRLPLTGAGIIRESPVGRLRDSTPAEAAGRESARVSTRARRKAATKTTAEGWPAHSLQTLLGDLSTLALNKVVLPAEHQTAIAVSTKLTPLQRETLELLGGDPNQAVPIAVTG